MYWETSFSSNSTMSTPPCLRIALLLEYRGRFCKEIWDNLYLASVCQLLVLENNPIYTGIQYHSICLFISPKNATCVAYVMRSAKNWSPAYHLKQVITLFNIEALRTIWKKKVITLFNIYPSCNIFCVGTIALMPVQYCRTAKNRINILKEYYLFLQLLLGLIEYSCAT